MTVTLNEMEIKDAIDNYVRDVYKLTAENIEIKRKEIDKVPCIVATVEIGDESEETS